MNGVKGMLVKYQYCGREVFLRAIAGKYTTGESYIPTDDGNDIEFML